jgi:hypothetical protein
MKQQDPLGAPLFHVGEPGKKKITVIYSNVQVHCTYRGTTKNAKAQAALSWSNKRILSSFFPCVCC